MTKSVPYRQRNRHFPVGYSYPSSLSQVGEAKETMNTTPEICANWRKGVNKVTVWDRDGANNKKCIIRMLRCVCKPCPHAALHRIQMQLSSRCTAPQVIYSSNFHKHQKKISSLAYDIHKNWFWGYHFRWFSEGWPSQTMSKYLFFKHLLIKKNNALAWAVQKLIFGGPFEGLWGSGTPKLCQNIFCSLNIY